MRFRTIYFLPDPISGARVPIALLLEDGRNVSAIRYPHIPGAMCLGGVAEEAAVEMILADIEQRPDFGRLPPSAGPQAFAGEPREVPAVADARRWVDRAVFGLAPDVTSSERVEQHAPHPHRATMGFQFLEKFRVAKFVRKTFQPGKDEGGFLAEANALGTISQYVAGRTELLLMEPILPRRESWKADATSVARSFGAYKTVLRGHPAGRKARLVAYVVPGGSQERRTEIEGLLKPFADQIVDTSSEAARGRFFGHIRVTAISGGYQDPMIQ